VGALAKALPKIYGEKLTAEVTGKDGAPLGPVDVVETARNIAFIFAEAQEELDKQAAEAGKSGQASSVRH
jgi:hypothetical protein